MDAIVFSVFTIKMEHYGGIQLGEMKKTACYNLTLMLLIINFETGS